MSSFKTSSFFINWRQLFCVIKKENFSEIICLRCLDQNLMGSSSILLMKILQIWRYMNASCSKTLKIHLLSDPVTWAYFWGCLCIGGRERGGLISNENLHFINLWVSRWTRYTKNSFPTHKFQPTILLVLNILLGIRKSGSEISVKNLFCLWILISRSTSYDLPFWPIRMQSCIPWGI